MANGIDSESPVAVTIFTGFYRIPWDSIDFMETVHGISSISPFNKFVEASVKNFLLARIGIHEGSFPVGIC